MNPLKKEAEKIINTSKNVHEIISDKAKLNQLWKHTIIWDGKELAKKGWTDLAGGVLEELYNIRLIGKVYNHIPHADSSKWCRIRPGLYIDEYQIGAILDIRNQYQMNFCGRSVGKSTVMSSLPAAHWGAWLPYFDQMVYDTDRPMAIRFILIGNTLDTSKAMLQYIRAYLTQNPLTESLIDINNDSKTYLRLKNGTEYFVRSANNIRGLNPASFKSRRYGKTIFGRTIILIDEYARVKRPNILDEDLSAYMNFSNGCLFIANTTPWGKDNHAYKQSKEPRFKTRNFPTSANIHMQNRQNLVELKKWYEESGQKWIWNEEHMGMPSANHGQIFPNSWIDRVTYSEEEEEKRGSLWDDKDIDTISESGEFKGFKYYLGGDPNKGKTGNTDHGNPRITDDSALSIVEETTGAVLRLRYARLFTKSRHFLPGKIFGEQLSAEEYIEKIRWLYKKVPLKYGILDLNPGGGLVAALHTASTGQIKNVGVFDTDNGKLCEAAIQWLYTLGLEGRFRMPNDGDLARSFQAFNTQNKKTGFKKTDLVWSIIFACWNIQKTPVSEWSAGVRQGSSTSRIARPTLAQVQTYAGSRMRPTLTGGGRY